MNNGLIGVALLVALQLAGCADAHHGPQAVIVAPHGDSGTLELNAHFSPGEGLQGATLCGGDGGGVVHYMSAQGFGRASFIAPRSTWETMAVRLEPPMFQLDPQGADEAEITVVVDGQPIDGAVIARQGVTRFLESCAELGDGSMVTVNTNPPVDVVVTVRLVSP